MSLEIAGLVAGRSGFRVGPLSLTVAAGSTVCLLGPNGGGKTTLLKTLAGLLKPLAGSVRIDGVELSSADSSRRAAMVAYLPPPGEVDASFRTRHVVALGRLSRRPWPADLSPADEAAAEAALTRLGVGALADRPFDTLSSGQRQLALIARLLLQDARVCLLDEPSATLDPARRAEVRAALDTLAGTGRTVIWSTHEVGEARRADLCVTVGRDLLIGPPDAMLTPARLAALYGSALALCPACGGAHG